ncbi:MAG TPA: outer membrane beta-barrel protein [Acidobacteriaceae bacterium]|jgi:hypothetical protein
MKKAAHFLLTTAVVLALSAVSRHANGQAYATASGPGSYVAVGGGASLFQADYGKRDIGGAQAFVDINPTWRYGIEAEGRWLRYHTDEDVTETNYFIGPRVSIRPGPFRPYAKFMVGAGHIVLPFHYAEGTFFTMAPGGGIEYTLGDRFAVRIVDFEYQLWHNFPYGSLRPYGVSAGLSFRINGLHRYPKNAGRYRRQSH